MCVEISNNMEINNSTSNKKISYSVKKLLKQIFKQHKSQKLANQQNSENAKKAELLDSLESLENSRNASIEDDSATLESYENDINERLSSEVTTIVPVHFVRTEHGTFFWTAASNIIPADNDLVEPAHCFTYTQLPCLQDRWAQA